MTEGRKQVRTIESDDIDEANEYELIHVTGTTTNSSDISDPDFGIIAQNSYRLKRKVEMYQWREIVKKDGDDTHYRYEETWSEDPIDSTKFHDFSGHQNPSNAWPFRSRTFEASTIMLGKFRLRPDQILRLGRGSSTKVSLDEECGS